MVDYRKFRLGKLKTEEFSHLLLLIFWPLYGMTFWLLERGISLTYHPVYCPLDDKIPFCEFFIPAYYFWFVFLVGIHIYTLLFDIPLFKKLMYFIMITYLVTCIIYVIYPTMQELRPTEFERDNIFTDIAKGLYNFDTNTNVCPSLHVVGSFAVLFTAWNSKHFSSAGWRIAFSIITVLICASTVFLKQHSVIDIVVALVLCGVAYPFAFVFPDKICRKNAQKTQKYAEKQLIHK